MGRPLREQAPATAREAMEDVHAAIKDLEELIELPGLPEEAKQLAAQAALRMTSATMCLVILLDRLLGEPR